MSPFSLIFLHLYFLDKSHTCAKSMCIKLGTHVYHDERMKPFDFERSHEKKKTEKDSERDQFVECIFIKLGTHVALMKG